MLNKFNTIFLLHYMEDFYCISKISWKGFYYKLSILYVSRLVEFEFHVAW